MAEHIKGFDLVVEPIGSEMNYWNDIWLLREVSLFTIYLF